MGQNTGRINACLNRILALGLLSASLFFAVGCKGGEEPTVSSPRGKSMGIEGRVTSRAQPRPFMEGLSVSAIAGGKEVNTAKVNPRTGEYSIELEKAGDYDLRLRTPTGVLDFNYNVRVPPGRAVKAPDIELPVGALAPPSTEVSASTAAAGQMKPPAGAELEAAALEGAVYPADAEVKLLDGEEIVARVRASAGKFKIPDVSPGLYDVEFSAPGYADTSIKNVAVSTRGAAKSLNGFLLYRSALDGVDYEKGVITATGMGRPNADMSPGQASVMACRAARTTAIRNLLDTILSLKVAEDKSVRDIDASGEMTTKLEGFVKGAKPIRRKKHDDGSCEVTLRVPLHGPSGVTRFFQEVMEKQFSGKGRK